MSQLQKVVEWQVAAGVQYDPQASLESLQGLPLTLIREEIKETLNAAKAGDYLEIVDGCADVMVVAQALLHRLGCPFTTDYVLRPDSPERIKLSLQEITSNLSSIINTINDEALRYNLDREQLELLARTALLSAKELLHYCGVSPATTLRLVNDSNFSKFASTFEEASRSLQLYNGETRYSEIQIRPINDYFVIVGRSEGQSELKVLKALGYTKPKLKLLAKQARDNVEMGVSK